jgi:archaellum component FlaC
MSSPRSNLERENSAKGGVLNHYLNSMMAPLKTLSFKEGVLLVEEFKAPKNVGALEERLDALEEKTSRYSTVVERSLDAHHFMNMELEKKVEEYKERIKDLEERYIHVISQLDKFQALVWDQKNQNYEYEERFKKIAEVASLRYNDPPMYFYNGKPFPWKMEEWKEDYESDEEGEYKPTKEEDHKTVINMGSPLATPPAPVPVSMVRVNVSLGNKRRGAFISTEGRFRGMLFQIDT